ncbi:hypothetical protein GO613_19490 [Azoarcus communis]|uniref:hypothetical protein n=1 Tax=Parazoarcus communis TaxID=41977 RepID=UPI001459F843|nr:hypothetical protein [Parazoarcus communis]NMG50280.1 hypothetical protein [Parazoarcus communis]
MSPVGGCVRSERLRRQRDEGSPPGVGLRVLGQRLLIMAVGMLMLLAVHTVLFRLSFY